MNSVQCTLCIEVHYGESTTVQADSQPDLHQRTKSLQGAINEMQETRQVTNIFQETCRTDIVCVYSGLTNRAALIYTS